MSRPRLQRKQQAAKIIIISLPRTPPRRRRPPSTLPELAGGRRTHGEVHERTPQLSPRGPIHSRLPPVSASSCRSTPQPWSTLFRRSSADAAARAVQSLPMVGAKRLSAELGGGTSVKRGPLQRQCATPGMAHARHGFEVGCAWLIVAIVFSWTRCNSHLSQTMNVETGRIKSTLFAQTPDRTREM